jgi:hypothetical protein
VAGKADDLVDQLQRLAQARSSGSSPISRMRSVSSPLVEKKPQICEDRRRDRVLGQAHGAADLADRALAAVMDHRGAEPGAVAAVAFVDVLDHLLAALMLEIDVDVGRLVARLGDEALEDHGADLGADAGDAEA